MSKMDNTPPIVAEDETGRVWVLNAPLSAMRDANGAWSKVPPIGVEELEEYWTPVIDNKEKATYLDSLGKWLDHQLTDVQVVAVPEMSKKLQTGKRYFIHGKKLIMLSTAPDGSATAVVPSSGAKFPPARAILDGKEITEQEYLDISQPKRANKPERKSFRQDWNESTGVEKFKTLSIFTLLLLMAISAIALGVWMTGGLVLAAWGGSTVALIVIVVIVIYTRG